MHFKLFTTAVVAFAASLVSAGPIQRRADDVQPAFSGVLQSPAAGSSVAIGSNITFSYTPNVSACALVISAEKSACFSPFLRLTDLLVDRPCPAARLGDASLWRAPAVARRRAPRSGPDRDQPLPVLAVRDPRARNWSDSLGTGPRGQRFPHGPV